MQMSITSVSRLIQLAPLWEPIKGCKRKSMRGNSKEIERRQLYLVTRAWETGYTSV